MSRVGRGNWARTRALAGYAVQTAAIGRRGSVHLRTREPVEIELLQPGQSSMYTEVLRDGIGVALSVEHAIHRKVLGTVRGNDVEERLVELPGTSDPHSSTVGGLKDEIAN